MPSQVSVIQIAASAARTTQGVSGTQPGAAGVVDCDGYAAIAAMVSVTTGGLTVTSFRVWLQGTMDLGATWFNLVHQNVLKMNNADGLNSTAIASNLTVSYHSLLAEGGNVTGTTIYFGTVNNPPPYVRAAWEINGTSPSETFSVIAYLSRVPSV